MSARADRAHGRRWRTGLAVLAALILSFGIPLAFRAYFLSEAGLPVVLLPVGLTALAGIIRRLGRRRWWVEILTALPPLAFAALLLAGILITPYSSYAIWMENVLSGTPSGSVSLIFQMAFGFFASILAPMVLSSGWMLPLALLATSVCGLLTVIFQSTALTVATLILVAVSLVVVMARTSHRGHRIAAGVFYIAAMAGCLLVGRLFAGPGTAQGSRFVDVTLYPALRQLVTDVLPGLPLIYEIPGYGFSFASKQLGGPTALSSTGVFTVEGEPSSTAYLRTEVYDFYDGQSWDISEPAWDSTEEERRYMGSSFYHRGEKERLPGDIGITVQAEYYARLPTTSDTVSLSFPAAIPMVERGNMNTGISLKRPMKQGERFIIHRANTAQAPWVRAGLSASMRGMYTQIPDKLPAEIRELADIINPDVSDKRSVLENIRQFLAIRASYNLRPEEGYTRGGGDFVAGFLLSQNPEGYCVHFATSLVILARLAGIPARYATGFLVYFPEETGMAEVRGYSSHAWPEVWLEGSGWVTFEATAAVDPAYYDLYGDALRSRTRINMNRSTAAQIEALLGRQVTSGPGTAAALPFSLPPWAATAALGTGAAALLALALLLISGRVRYLFLRDAQRYRFHMKALVRRLERQGVATPDRVGWVTWWRIMEEREPDHVVPIRETRDTVLRVVYWDGYFRKQHVQALAAFRKRYERRLASGDGKGR